MTRAHRREPHSAPAIPPAAAALSRPFLPPPALKLSLTRRPRCLLSHKRPFPAHRLVFVCAPLALCGRGTDLRAPVLACERVRARASDCAPVHHCALANVWACSCARLLSLSLTHVLFCRSALHHAHAPATRRSLAACCCAWLSCAARTAKQHSFKQAL
eukprot:6198051-Pleurochrysis_carterae.AAC.1